MNTDLIDAAVSEALPVKVERLKAMAAELQAMFPTANLVSLDANFYSDGVSARVTIHGHKTYAEATEEMRSLGVGLRNKTPYAPGELIGAYTRLEGNTGGLSVITYPDELPPSCRLEKVIEKVPKTETREVGEFVEIERTKVVCGEALQKVEVAG